MDLDQLAVIVPGFNDIQAVSADGDWFFAVVMGIAELCDDRITQGFTVHGAAASPNGGGVTATVPTDPITL